MFHFMYLLLYKFIFELLSFECSFVSVVYIVCFSIMSQHKLWEQNIQQTTPQSVKAFLQQRCCTDFTRHRENILFTFGDEI